MKSVLRLALWAIVPFLLMPLQAELTAVAVLVEPADHEPEADPVAKGAKISILSVDEEDCRTGVSVEEAAEVLRQVEGSGSAVCVVIDVRERVSPMQSAPLVEAIRGNWVMELVALRNEDEVVAENGFA